mmetsp:Transcript_142/g.169  ORF Transcript_142/g.169 Transcript_142/m.169 type:complete len:560 (-) Transcript_142:319-1998(-)
MKSKRNRKRPISVANGVNKDLIYETRVRPLEIDGKPIETNHNFLRTIKPYVYTYTTYAKGRWEGRTILDVYSTEYGSYPKSYYETAIKQGRILVSDAIVSTSYVIKGGDILSHTVHRHEPGVAVQSDVEPFVTVVKETDELLIIDKPGTMAVHPCGGYNMQSLVNILQEHYNSPYYLDGKLDKLYPVHRLDRLTSGLVILGKNSSVAQTLGKCIMNRNGCKKFYLARVQGQFPLKHRSLKKLNKKQYIQTGIPLHGEWGNGTNDISLLRKKHALVYWVEDEHGCPVFEDTDNDHNNILCHSVDEWLTPNDGIKKRWFHLACPTRIVQHKDGICEASSFDNLDDNLYKKTVKPAHSSFGVVSYDLETHSTLLICRPYTGRTHQLRLHLQYLNHPIANDPNYGGDIWYKNPTGRECCNIAQTRLSVLSLNDEVSVIVTDKKSSAVDDIVSKNRVAITTKVTTKTTAIDVPATEMEVQEGVSTSVQEKEESIHEFIARTCVWCARSRAVSSEDRAILEFVIRSPGIWLHALQYSFELTDPSNDSDEVVNSCFRTNLPVWHDF